MKIFLISIINNKIFTNTGIEHISRFLRENLPRDVISARFFHGNYKFEDIIKSIPLHFDFYGFSIFETNYQLSKEIAQWIKQYNKFAKIIFGGQFITMNYQDIIRDAKIIDYFIIGDGEGPLLELFLKFKKDNNITIKNKSIATIDDYKEKMVNIEQNVERETSFDYYDNDSIDNNSDKTHSLMTKSNVCVGSCSFCCSRKGKLKYRSAENIFNEIYKVHSKYSIIDFWFTDDDLFDLDNNENRCRLKQLFTYIIESKMKVGFSAFSKPKSICNPLNRDLIKLMSYAGMHHIFLGIDGGNINDIKIYNKRSSLEEGRDAISILRKFGIGVRFGLIFINPYTSLDTMRQSYKYISTLKSTNYFHYGGLKVHLLNRTKLLEKVRDDGLLCSRYSFLNTNAYKFKNIEIIDILDILDELFPQLDKIEYQFNILRYQYERAIHLVDIPTKYKQFINLYTNIELEKITNYFHRLYINNDFKYCVSNLNKFIIETQQRAKIYEKIVIELREICSRRKNDG